RFSNDRCTSDTGVGPAPIVDMGAYESIDADAGPDQSICSGGTVQLAGKSTNATGCTWSTSGDGSFDNPASLTALYTPGPNDRASGTVTLTLTSNACNPKPGDTMVVTIQGAPTATQGTIAACYPDAASANAAALAAVTNLNPHGPGTVAKAI